MSPCRDGTSNKTTKNTHTHRQCVHSMLADQQRRSNALHLFHHETTMTGHDGNKLEHGKNFILIVGNNNASCWYTRSATKGSGLGVVVVVSMFHFGMVWECRRMAFFYHLHLHQLTFFWRGFVAKAHDPRQHKRKERLFLDCFFL